MKKTKPLYLIIGAAFGIGIGIVCTAAVLTPNKGMEKNDSSLTEEVIQENPAEEEITETYKGAEISRDNDEDSALLTENPAYETNPNPYNEKTSTYYKDLAESLTREEADKRGIEIMELSGTWSGFGTSELDHLIPHMSPEAVDRVVQIYLERHLFPEITTSEGAMQVAAVIEYALDYMTDEGKENSLQLLNEYK